MVFNSDITSVNKIGFRPYMIECAFDYYNMAVISNHQRMGLQTVMSALSIEIILKSFHASITSNHGRLDETYEFDKASLIKNKILPKKANVHDLIVLYDALPCDLQAFLFESFEVDTLKVNRKLFTDSRYVYEQKANTIHNDDIIKLAARLICKVVYLYKEQGCTDLFVERFDVDKLYFSHVQPYVLAKAL